MSDPNLTRIIEFPPRKKGLFEEIADAITPHSFEEYLVRGCGAEVVSLSEDELGAVEDVLATHCTKGSQAQEDM